MTVRLAMVAGATALILLGAMAACAKDDDDCESAGTAITLVAMDGRSGGSSGGKSSSRGSGGSKPKGSRSGSSKKSGTGTVAGLGLRHHDNDDCDDD